mmetsp:Transcript_32401/g.103084  ORF Transcript_32401/g.103084 Transcript_32401/m.103084 type:complete len:405 (+) Transcript_32401:35-1249(+)
MSANGTILLLPRAPHVPGGVGGGGGAGIMGVPAPTARAGVEMITSAGSSAWGGLQARLGVAARGKKLRSVAEARGRAGTAVLALRCVKSQSQSQSLAMGAGGSNPPAAFGAGLEIGARPAGHGDEAAGEPSLVVFSGGTAFNGVAPRLKDLTTRVSHVLPVSDDGGSTAEIVRFLGGPAVGDIRSRCLRLAEAGNEEALAVRELLAHRLHPTDHIGAKAEWLAITEGEHALWDGISDPYKHTIRAFLVHFQFLVMRSSNNARFSFVNGSVGNFFFAGARTFFGSMDSAIFSELNFSSNKIIHASPASLALPCICTEEPITLELRHFPPITSPPLQCSPVSAAYPRRRSCSHASAQRSASHWGRSWMTGPSLGGRTTSRTPRRGGPRPTLRRWRGRAAASPATSS